MTETMRAGLIASALLLAGCETAAPEQPLALTRAQVREMPPDQLTRRLFGGLAPIMYPLPHNLSVRSSPAFQPLRGLSFMTRPRTGYRQGICETDRVIVEFEPVPFALGDDPPVRPRRFEIFHNFLVRDLALARQDLLVDEERVAQDDACAATDPRNAQIVVADTESEVIDGLQLISELVENAASGRAPGSVECRDVEGEPRSASDCLSEVARLRPDSMYYAALLPGCARNDPHLYCRRIDLHDSPPYLITFELRRGHSRTPVRVRVERDMESLLY